jgi:nucleotide-binding universal stress UspA family protein
MYRKILYPIKFEEFSLELLSCILNFKKAGTEEIVLLHVLDVAKLPMDKYEGYHPDDVKRLTEIARLKMVEAVGIIEGSGLKAKERIEVGVPYREILRVADEESVSLIVSGRQKKGVIGEIFIGSNTDKVIRYGNVPVYVLKYPAVFGGDRKACARYCSTPFSRVLCPTDWSVCAGEALRYLKGLKEAGVEEVVVAHIMDEKAMGLQPPEKFKEFEKTDREKLATVRQELEKEGFNVTARLHVGKAGKDLIEIARQEDTSLVIMGVHGKGYVEGILWGSVSRNVVEYSDRPVLLVKGAGCREGKVKD